MLTSPERACMQSCDAREGFWECLSSVLALYKVRKKAKCHTLLLCHIISMDMSCIGAINDALNDRSVAFADCKSAYSSTPLHYIQIRQTLLEMETSCSHRCIDSAGTFTGLRRWPHQPCARRRMLRQESRQLRVGVCCGTVKSMPIFPLNCVSFPSSAMPLNIFEARCVHLRSPTTMSSPYLLRQSIYDWR